MSRRILAAAVLAAAVLTPAPADAAADCRNIISTGTVRTAIVATPTTAYITIKGTRCGRTDSLTRITVGYRPNEGSTAMCPRVRSITMNPSPIAGYNPPAVTLPCSRAGASKNVPLGQVRTLPAGTSGDRNTYATWKVDTKAADDNEARTTDASLQVFG